MDLQKFLNLTFNLLSEVYFQLRNSGGDSEEMLYVCRIAKVGMSNPAQSSGTGCEIRARSRFIFFNNVVVPKSQKSH